MQADKCGNGLMGRFNGPDLKVLGSSNTVCLVEFVLFINLLNCTFAHPHISRGLDISPNFL
jgi:hypothetical protein